MPTLTARDVEDYLLGLVARETGKTITQLRDEELLFPDDPPWDSEMLCHFQGEIEADFKIEFEDAIETERRSRTLASLASYIVDLLAAASAQTA
jgi:hypothetical protein